MFSKKLTIQRRKKGSVIETNIELKSGIYAGKISSRRIDLWKAFSVLQDAGFEARYEPPPYAVQIKVECGTVLVFENASVNLSSKSCLAEIECDLKKIVKLFDKKEVLK